MPIILTHVNNTKHADIALENKQLRAQVEQVQAQLPKEGAHLVVNGQIRKIGKKSQYLLDMLTLPED